MLYVCMGYPISSTCANILGWAIYHSLLWREGITLAHGISFLTGFTMRNPARRFWNGCVGAKDLYARSAVISVNRAARAACV
jgi:hypothetical protein